MIMSKNLDKSNMDNNPAITVCILTYNGERYIEQLLEAVFRQKIHYKFEVLVIDSGSTDQTLEIVGKFGDVILHQIDNSEFGHGKTRNLGAQLAKGDIVAYLTHDAVPANDNWLYEITKPFELNDKIVAVLGRQKPRAHCFPLLRYEIKHVFGAQGPVSGTTLYYKDNKIKKQSLIDAMCFYSDVNSAARREFLTNTIPYKEVDYAEDQLFGRDLINAGYIKAYASRATVYHSNDLTLREYKYRIFDETLGLRRAGILIQPYPTSILIKALIKGVIFDTVRILRDSHFSFFKKLYWVLVNPLYHLQKFRGIHRAFKDLTRDEIADTSLESKKRS